VGQGTPHSDRRAASIDFAADRQLARPLRGRTLTETQIASWAQDLPGPGDAVLAAARGRAIWWSQADAPWSQFSIVAPQELGEREVLRERLKAGRFVALVPLLHLLRAVCHEHDREQPPLRASFVIDDPNLHRPSYGYLDYARLIAHARDHGYHVGLAMVPLDGWLINRRAAAMVRENPAALSLLMHGNNHLADELGRARNDHDAEVTLAQALRRTAAFERRSGLPVGRVMVPPHEACSMSALKAMSRLGFDAACIGRRLPWKSGADQHAEPWWPLMKWHPADMIDGTLPILPRYLLDRPREDLVFRALLRQPLILYGHHWDFADGLEILADATSYINGLGDVRWNSAATIARHGAFTRSERQTLVVEMHARRATVSISDGTSAIRVTVADGWGEPPGRLVATGIGQSAMTRQDHGWISDALAAPSRSKLELELEAARTVDPQRIAIPRAAPWAVARRAIVELRDRARPLWPGAPASATDDA
jgi:hypothetical protein